MIKWLTDLGVALIVGVGDKLAARRQRSAPVEERHAWDEWEPPPSRRKRETPVCVFCGAQQTRANKLASCPKVSDPPQVQP